MANKMRSDRFGGKALVYFGLYDAQEVPGIHQKVMGVLSAAKAAGFETRSWAEPFSKTAPLRRLAEAISAAPESHLILRSLGFANLFLLPALMRARRRGARVTIDVPSPNRVAVKEIWRSQQSFWRRVRTVVAFYVSGPWSLWPATRIVQYAPEGWWFRLGNASRTVEIGNGIDVAPIAAPPPRAGLAVAPPAPDRGGDRGALAWLRSPVARGPRIPGSLTDRTFDVHVTIVGDGPALPHCAQLAASLDLADHVTFAGSRHRRRVARPLRVRAPGGQLAGPASHRPRSRIGA